MHQHTTHSPIGTINVTTENGTITKLDVTPGDNSSATTKDDLTQQLQTYFRDPTHEFTLKTNPHGTPFQQRVWQALTNIPPGTTLTYGDLAKQLNSHPRAIGQACRRNPIPIIIPCHRVVGATSMGGYSGQTQGAMANIKKWLLEHEKGHCHPERTVILSEAKDLQLNHMQLK